MLFDGTDHFRESLVGVKTVAPLSPLGGESDFTATHYAWFGQGGYKVANTLGELMTLPWQRRELGMKVRVLFDGQSEIISVHDYTLVSRTNQKLTVDMFGRATFSAPFNLKVGDYIDVWGSDYVMRLFVLSVITDGLVYKVRKFFGKGTLLKVFECKSFYGLSFIELGDKFVTPPYEVELIGEEPFPASGFNQVLAENDRIALYKGGKWYFFVVNDSLRLVYVGGDPAPEAGIYTTVPSVLLNGNFVLKRVAPAANDNEVYTPKGGGVSSGDQLTLSEMSENLTMDCWFWEEIDELIDLSTVYESDKTVSDSLIDLYERTYLPAYPVSLTGLVLKIEEGSGSPRDPDVYLEVGQRIQKWRLTTLLSKMAIYDLCEGSGQSQSSIVYHSETPKVSDTVDAELPWNPEGSGYATVLKQTWTAVSDVSEKSTLYVRNVNDGRTETDVDVSGKVVNLTNTFYFRTFAGLLDVHSGLTTEQLLQDALTTLGGLILPGLSPQPGVWTTQWVVNKSNNEPVVILTAGYKASSNKSIKFTNGTAGIRFLWFALPYSAEGHAGSGVQVTSGSPFAVNVLTDPKGIIIDGLPNNNFWDYKGADGNGLVWSGPGGIVVKYRLVVWKTPLNPAETKELYFLNN